MTRGRRLIVSVDLDMWYHCRWATGGPNSLWPNVEDALACHYGWRPGDSPPADLETLTLEILELLDEARVRATFFVLGEVALRYPALVRRIAERGHEVASHGLHHQDATCLDDRALARSLAESRAVLENLIGQAVEGFRFPNLVVGRRELVELARQGFRYDSSLCFSRAVAGKFGHGGRVRQNPYRLDLFGPERDGGQDLWEFPVPVFPLLRLPAATGIATRVFGRWWTHLALNHALRQGDAVYYFHPYELSRWPELRKRGPYVKLFLRRTGRPFRDDLIRLLQNFTLRALPVTAREYLRERNTSPQ